MSLLTLASEASEPWGRMRGSANTSSCCGEGAKYDMEEVTVVVVGQVIYPGVGVSMVVLGVDTN